MLFRVVQGLHSAIFSFLLIFSDLGQKMTYTETAFTESMSF